MEGFRSTHERFDGWVVRKYPQWNGTCPCTAGRETKTYHNAVERCIRPFVVGRKNWLFADTPKGAKASANLYSLVETAKANKLDPWAYLEKLFTDLPSATTETDIEALLPWNVKLRASATRAAKP